MPVTRPNPPLVSVGIPTYNRRDGLARTLNCVLNQTYPHLEVIVSDNCSLDAGIEQMMTRVTGADPRVRYIRQPKNIGMHNNFKFVLGKATGEFYMWAADDDEWDETFIEQCLENIGQATSVISGCSVLFRATARQEVVALPRLNPNLGIHENLKLFLGSMAPGFFYGLHRRASLDWVSAEAPFDWWDCYFVVRQIVQGGFATFPEKLFTMGIDGKSYECKPFDPEKGRLFRYQPFLCKVGRLILRHSKLSLPEKVELLNVTLDYMSDAFVRYEGETRPGNARLVAKLFSAKKKLIRYGRKALRIIRRSPNGQEEATNRSRFQDSKN